MDPTLPKGTVESISAADKRALDLIGYDTDADEGSHADTDAESGTVPVAHADLRDEG